MYSFITYDISNHLAFTYLSLLSLSGRLGAFVAPTFCAIPVRTYTAGLLIGVTLLAAFLDGLVVVIVATATVESVVIAVDD